MTEREIDRIKKAEQAMKEVVEVAAQIRKEIEGAGMENRDQIRELQEAAQEFEREAQRIKDSLRVWRQEIN